MTFFHTLSADALRLDRFLADTHPDIARSRWESWIREGHVTINGGVAKKPGEKLKAGYVVAGTLPDMRPPGITLEAEALAFPTLFEDDTLWIIDKPAGVVVHPGPGHPGGTVVNGLLWRLKLPLAQQEGTPVNVDSDQDGDEALDTPGDELAPTVWPGLVHRLDRYTTGCLVTTKTQAAQQALQSQFKARTVDKRYLAVVRASRRLPQLGSLLVDAPLARHRVDRLKMTVQAAGRPSQTRVKVLGQAAGLALVECELLTGRTHQIRVHLSHLGAPILGDPLYGGATRWQDEAKQPITCEHPMLHAWRLAVDHPESGQRIQVEAPLPGPFADLLGQLGISVESASK